MSMLLFFHHFVFFLLAPCVRKFVVYFIVCGCQDNIYEFALQMMVIVSNCEDMFMVFCFSQIRFVLREVKRYCKVSLVDFLDARTSKQLSKFNTTFRRKPQMNF